MIKKFRITSANRADVIPVIGQYLKALNCDEAVEVVVKPYKRNRNNDQNALYWKWITIIGNDLGYDKDEMHELLAYKFLGLEQKEIDGRKFEQIRSTTKLSVGGMSEYMERVQRWAAEMGVRLPSLEDV